MTDLVDYLRDKLEHVEAAARKTLTCYGEPYATVDTEGEARSVAEAHILVCPKGAMEWATTVTWRRADDGALCSADHGEWLNHHIEDAS